MIEILKRIKDEGNGIVDENLLELICSMFSNINSVKLDLKNLEIFIKDKELNILLTSKRCISLNFLAWKNVINMYISQERYHIYDDIYINSALDLNDLEKQLTIWLFNDIREKKYVKENQIKYIEFSYLHTEKIIYENTPLFFNKRKYTIQESTYEKWTT